MGRGKFEIELQLSGSLHFPNSLADNRFELWTGFTLGNGNRSEIILEKGIFRTGFPLKSICIAVRQTHGKLTITEGSS